MKIDSIFIFFRFSCCFENLFLDKKKFYKKNDDDDNNESFIFEKILMKSIVSIEFKIISEIFSNNCYVVVLLKKNPSLFLILFVIKKWIDYCN